MGKNKAAGTALETWLVNKVNGLSLTDLHAERVAEGGSKDLGDVRISTNADEPWLIECKARETLSVTTALKKAREKNKEGKTALFWKRIVKGKGKVRQPMGERYVVILTLEDFLLLLEGDV